MKKQKPPRPAPRVTVTREEAAAASYYITEAIEGLTEELSGEKEIGVRWGLGRTIAGLEAARALLKIAAADAAVGVVLADPS